MSRSLPLTPVQTHALFDILTHHQVYAEIEAFKTPEGVASHGYPYSKRIQQQQQQQGATKNGGRSSLWGGGGSGGGSSSSSFKDLSLQDKESEDEDVSGMPVMQLLMTTFVMRLPALRMLPRDFWAVSYQGLVTRLAAADLSESYDKGSMGARKTVATGLGAVLEMISRGYLGGVEGGAAAAAAARGNGASPENIKRKRYDLSDGADLERAWNDILDGLVHGGLVDELFEHMERSTDLEAHSAAAEAAVRYIVAHLAAVLHHVFVRMPSGRHLLALIDGVHRMVPYRMIRQTLRVGNAATMINGMMRLLLAKLSVASITNWAGLTRREDDGMNLLQNIISAVLSRDASPFKKTARKIDKMADNGGGGGGDDYDYGGENNDDVYDSYYGGEDVAPSAAPTGEMLEAIRAHVEGGDAASHEAVRRASMAAGESVIVTIFRASDRRYPELESLAAQVSASGSEQQHEACLAYYAALLAVRDRRAITTVLCRQAPDLFTRTIKEAVAAYNPLIRDVHEGVNLGDHMQDLQTFLDEFLRVSMPWKGRKRGAAEDKERAVTVEDYVTLLSGHKGLLYKFLHAIASRCPEVSDAVREWCNDSIAEFRRRDAGATQEKTTTGGGAGSMDRALRGLVGTLDEESRAAVLGAADAHAAYLASLKGTSDGRLTELASHMEDEHAGRESGKNYGRGEAGPGVYLARWRDFLDETAMTPAETGRSARVRTGRDVRGRRAKGEVVAPDVGVVVERLGGGFREVLQGVNLERRVFEV